MVLITSHVLVCESFVLANLQRISICALQAYDVPTTRETTNTTSLNLVPISGCCQLKEIVFITQLLQWMFMQRLGKYTYMLYNNSLAI